MVTAREQRSVHAANAREVQVQGALLGSAKGGMMGLVFALFANRTWPAFTRKTLQFKCFVVSGFALAGFALGAENALMRFEASQRLHENKMRERAQVALTNRGVMPTETAIQAWNLEQRELRQATTETSD
ncbi:hypothetical protein BKA62DRAFT_619802 [Auriculariales sp. MPI-PUGE-AT-0066]|nr:hypothetical protein BKA62DRAFT_619802 [Auriculariales sp. MPI-PUGE-AT-0066]